MQFTSNRQQVAFESVLRGVGKLGYTGELLRRSYVFSDLFATTNVLRTIPAAAFGGRPRGFDNACLGLVLANGTRGASLLHQYRALGAPVMFELDEAHLHEWRSARKEDATVRVNSVPFEGIERYLHDQPHLSASRLLNAKNAAMFADDGQLDFFDAGLIPALEAVVTDKLDKLLRGAIAAGTAQYQESYGKEAPAGPFLRLTFRMLAAKMLHDRQHRGFRNIDPQDLTSILGSVENLYKTDQRIVKHAPTQRAIATHLWTSLSLENVSVDVLANIYENTLVTDATRKAQGTHSTPYAVARYILHRLPIEEIPEEDRFVMEPCSGHGIFLVAAMQRLRGLLSPDLASSKVHGYLAKRLVGLENDEFALEVSRLCLMLADPPYASGWRLQNEDVFNSEQFSVEARKARIFIGNPPFEMFKGDRYSQKGYKPARLLEQVFENMADGALLGFVMPRKFLDGKDYAEARNLMASRFGEMELVSLPDRVFENAAAETVLAISRAPASISKQTRIAYSYVEGRDAEHFLTRYEVSGTESAKRTPEEARESLLVVRLREVWEHLAENSPRLDSLASVKRGLEWKPDLSVVSEKPSPGFSRGLYSARGVLSQYCPPATVFVDTRPQSQKSSAYKHRWSQPKVLLNRGRASVVGHWCLSAFADDDGIVPSQRFYGIWLNSDSGWTGNTLAAVLNGPLANVFVGLRENKRDIQKPTVAAIPVPQLSAADVDALEILVGNYQDAVGSGRHTEGHALLCEIDSLVITGYGLPIVMAHRLVSVLDGQRRPIPFKFDYPDSFTSEQVYPMLTDAHEELRALLRAKEEKDLSKKELARLKRLEGEIQTAHETSPLVQHIRHTERVKFDDLKADLELLLQEARTLPKGNK